MAKHAQALMNNAKRRDRAHKIASRPQKKCKMKIFLSASTVVAILGAVAYGEGVDRSLAFDSLQEPIDCGSGGIDDEVTDSFNELLKYPKEVVKAIFGGRSGEEMPLFYVASISEAPGTYEGTTESGKRFSLVVDEVKVSSADLEAAIQDDEDMDDETESWMADNTYASFAVTGHLEGPAGASGKLIALLATTSTMEGEHVLVVLEKLNYPDHEGRGLNGKRKLQDWCPDGALDKAKDAFHCPPPGTLTVDEDCVAAAEATFQLAVNIAEGEHQNAKKAAEIAYELARAALLAFRIRKIAIAVAKCAAYALLPFVGTSLSIRCLLVETAKIIAIEVAKIVAAKAALAAAIALADKILALAIKAACAALLAGLDACLDCVYPPTPAPYKLSAKPHNF